MLENSGQGRRTMREVKIGGFTKEQLDEKYGKDAFILEGCYEDFNVYLKKPKSSGMTGIPLIALEKNGIFELHRDFIGVKAWTNCSPINS